MPTITSASISQMNEVELRALVLAMAAQPARKITAKVSEKGGLSVYGLGRFPVTLYRTQWERLLADDTVAQLKAFIAANAKLLAVKE